MKHYFIFVAFAVLVLASCSTPPQVMIDRAIADGEYSQAAKLHEQYKKKLYDNKSDILIGLNSGMLDYYIGNYEDSISTLQSTETAIEQAYTRSVTGAIASTITSYIQETYAGEEYEDIYINIYNALNYYHLGNIDEASVEIRKLSDKIAFIQAKYDALSAREEEKYLKSMAARYLLRDTNRLGVSVTYRKFVYKSALNDSALGRYLGILFFRAMGMGDSARVDFEAMEQLFFNAERLYNHPIPAVVREELDVKPNEARLNIVGFSGLNPIVVKERVRHELTSTLSFNAPKLLTRPSIVAKVEIQFTNGILFEMGLLENLGQKQTELMTRFAEQEKLLSIKYAPAAVVASSTALWTIGIVPIAISFFTHNKVDTRVSRYFPDRVYVGGITLAPGTYSFNVKYYDTSGGLIESVPFENVRIEAGRLNLVEANCFK